MLATIDLNSDLGEGFGAWKMGDDAAMLDLVSSANIACGHHAGDPAIMRRTVEMALDRNVAIGAHPGFNDPQGFGRRPILGYALTEIEAGIAYQVGALQGIAALAGHRVTHVKLHGALYNMANADEALALAAARAVRAIGRDLAHVCMPGRALERASERLGLRVAREFFADRIYEDDGSLRHREKPDAVIRDANEAALRVIRVLEDGALTTVSGKRIPIGFETICVHADEPKAVMTARKIRASLQEHGITIAPFSTAMQ